MRTNNVLAASLVWILQASPTERVIMYFSKRSGRESILSDPDIEPQGWGAVTEGLGAGIRKLLQQREGMPSIVRMAGGEEVVVYDVAWGRDVGDMWEHVTANLDPAHKENPVHFLILSEVQSVLDPLTGEILISQDPAPGQR